MNLVSTEWLEKNLNTVKIFDASWHMPSTNRDAIKEYEQKHIIGAIFWDVNEHSDKDSPYPHMMSNSDYWTRMLWSFGIQNNDHIIVYDNSDIYSSCRLWFALKYFGHEKVSVLDGGMKKWLNENRPTDNKINQDLGKFSSIDKLNPKKKYSVTEKAELIKNKKNSQKYFVFAIYLLMILFIFGFPKSLNYDFEFQIFSEQFIKFIE